MISFSLILDLFDPSFLQNLIFYHCLNPATKNLVKYPPPLGARRGGEGVDIVMENEGKMV